MCFRLEGDVGGFGNTTASVGQCVRPGEEPRAVVLLAVGIVRARHGGGLAPAK